LKKLLHLIESLATGGAEKLLASVINGLEGYEHHLVILNGPTDLRQTIKREHHFLNLGVNRKTDLPAATRRLRSYVRRHEIRTVHSHLYWANILARLATPRNVAQFNSIHAVSSLAAYRVNRLTKVLEKLTYRRRHHIVAVSHEVLRDFEEQIGLKGPATVLYNFVEEKFFAPVPKQNFSSEGLRMLAVGNLREQKNYFYLLEAFRHLPPSFSLDIYGEGPLRPAMQEFIDRHKLRVRMCGLSDRLHLLMPGYDLFVMSSSYEGQPLALLEAMASGLPALLSDIPVLREVAGDDALYFDLRDPLSFQARVMELREGKHDFSQLASGLHTRVHDFAHQHQYFERLNRLYDGAHV